MRWSYWFDNSIFVWHLIKNLSLRFAKFLQWFRIICCCCLERYMECFLIKQIAIAINFILLSERNIMMERPIDIFMVVKIFMAITWFFKRKHQLIISVMTFDRCRKQKQTSSFSSFFLSFLTTITNCRFVRLTIMCIINLLSITCSYYFNILSPIQNVITMPVWFIK